MQQQGTRSAGGSSAPPARGGGGGSVGGASTATRAVPLDQIVTDICAMGFERPRVMGLISSMQRSGQAIDLNAIIDRLTRGEY
jgi:hypothetical protein